MRRPSSASALIAVAAAVFTSFPAVAEPARVSLQLRWDNQFQFAGYYAAQWMGYYAAEGLEVEIRSAIKDGEILHAVRELAEGRADFGIGAADILVGIDRGAPLMVVSSFFQKSGAAYFTRVDTPLDSLADLARLKLARLENDLIDIEFQAAFIAEGIEPESISYVPQTTSSEGLASGQVGGIPGYVISFPFQLQQDHIEYKYLSPAQFGINFYGDSLFTTSRFLHGKRKVVDAFVRASIKGWIYAMEHPDEIALRITNELPNSSFRGDRLAFNRFQALEILELLEYPVVEPGHINAGRWQTMYDHLLRLGIVTRARKAESFIYSEQSYKAARLELFAAISILLACAATLFGLISLIFIRTLRKKIILRTAEIGVVKERLEKAQHHARIGSWTWDIKSDSLEWSDEMYNIFGIHKDGFTGYLPDVIDKAIHPDDREIVAASNNSVAQRGVPIPVEYRVIKPDGQIRTLWGEAGELVRNERGQPVSLSGFVQDITERKAIERDLEKSLEEKDVLIAEVHHRVKNNLNIISSLLDLQLSIIQSPSQAIAAFKTSRDRIKAMAIVHDMLYAAKNYACIDMGDYLKSLGRELLSAYGASERILLSTQADQVVLSVNESIPCALILHELISNALKHGLPGDRRGRVDVRLARGAMDQWELSVADDGVGIDEGCSSPSRATLGMTLVELLVEQLEGRLEISREHGTRVSIWFPRQECT